MKEIVESHLTPLRAEVKATRAFTRVPLVPANLKNGEFESALSNMVTDALLDYVST